MLQQTTVAAVVPYYRAFLKRWPTVEALAAAPLDDVLHAWQGLGYYARARNLHRAARHVAGALKGRFPEDESSLRDLPGVGAYTAAAIAAIAFGRKTAPVDGNVARVAARLCGLRQGLPAGRARIAALVLGMVPAARPGDFAEALMDLGAAVCTPRQPRCGACPWKNFCRARAAGEPEGFPAKKRKPVRPTRFAVIFWAEDGRGRVLVRRRPEQGLLGGMMEFPSTPWRESEWTGREALARAPAAGVWRGTGKSLSHAFTHFELRAEIVGARVKKPKDGDAAWWPKDGLGALALPSVMKKAARLVMGLENRSAERQAKRPRRSLVTDRKAPRKY